MLRLRSVSSIVIAPASTGKDNKRSTAVTITDHTNNGIRSSNIPNVRRFPRVLKKLTAPRIDLTPARCREKIAKSTDPPACATLPASGGYTVQPVPAPPSTSALDSNMAMAGAKNQKLMLFIRGNAMSTLPNMRGTNQFPNPPIKIGITMKKIIVNACAVTITL